MAQRASGSTGWDLARDVFASTGRVALIALGVAGAFGLWYRAELIEAGLVWLILPSGGAVFIAVCTLAGAVWAVCTAGRRRQREEHEREREQARRREAQFAGLAKQTEALAYDFSSYKSHRSKLLVDDAVRQMRTLAGELDGLGVTIVVESTETDDSARIEEVCKSNEKILTLAAYWMRKNDLESAIDDDRLRDYLVF